jgi:MFS transporter, DHA1 family, tetracycline resistance protein
MRLILRNDRAAWPFVLVSLALDVLAFGIVTPVLPQLLQRLGKVDARETALLFGLFLTAFAVVQFLASPVHGALSDRFGRRPTILAANFGLAVDYCILAAAPTIPWLFAGRVIAGACAGGMSAAYAYIADVTLPQTRAATFGLVGAAVGVGAGAAPLIGGFLGSLDLRAPFWAAAALCMANAVYGAIILPESLPPDRRTPLRWTMVNPVSAIVSLVAKYPRLGRVVIATMLFALGNQAIYSVNVIYTSHRYHWSPSDIGLLLSVYWLGGVAVQGVLTPIAVNRFGEWQTMVGGILCQILGVITLGLASTGYWFWAGTIAMTIGNISVPAWQALLSNTVSLNAQGRLAGASYSIRSLTLIVGPVMFTAVLAAALRSGREELLGLPFLLAGVLWILGLALAAHGLRDAAVLASPDAPIR